MRRITNERVLKQIDISQTAWNNHDRVYQKLNLLEGELMWTNTRILEIKLDLIRFEAFGAMLFLMSKAKRAELLVSLEELERELPKLMELFGRTVASLIGLRKTKVKEEAELERIKIEEGCFVS